MRLPSGALAPSETEIRLKLERVERKLAARRLIRLAKWIHGDYYDVNWHHDLLAHELDMVRTGETTRLAVFMPPQHGKSELVSRLWPAMLMGLNPDIRIIATSYNDDMAKFNATEIRSIITSSKYRELFGARRPSLDRSAAGDLPDNVHFWKFPGGRGHYLGGGIRGGITGKGFDVGIIDDPIKNDIEADSPTFRKALASAFHSVFESRGSGIAMGTQERIVAVFTRWRYDDLGGYLLKLGKRTGQPWRVIKLPAILTKDYERRDYDPRGVDEPLWPGRYPAKILIPRRDGMPARTWQAMYQQEPSDAEGTIFPPSRWSLFKWGDVQ